MRQPRSRLWPQHGWSRPSCGRWAGNKSPAHMLARRTGQRSRGAAQQLDAAKKLAEHPKTDAAARSGWLSREQAAAITDAADADPKAEDALLDLASRSSL